MPAPRISVLRMRPAASKAKLPLSVRPLSESSPRGFSLKLRRLRPASTCTAVSCGCRFRSSPANCAVPRSSPAQPGACSRMSFQSRRLKPAKLTLAVNGPSSTTRPLPVSRAAPRAASKDDTVSSLPRRRAVARSASKTSPRRIGLGASSVAAMSGACSVPAITTEPFTKPMAGSSAERSLKLTLRAVRRALSGAVSTGFQPASSRVPEPSTCARSTSAVSPETSRRVGESTTVALALAARYLS